MAQQLYKRYIPPKVPATTVSQQPPPHQKPQAKVDPQPEEAPKKRKRERTDEEIAERKAKKLRKKGIDPVTLPVVQKEPAREPAIEAAPVPPSNDSTEQPTAELQGEFAHIRSAKKRHKLQKQARKDRKAGNTGGDFSTNPDGATNVEKARSAADDGSHGIAVGAETMQDDAEPTDYGDISLPQTNGEASRGKTKSRREKTNNSESNGDPVVDVPPIGAPASEAQSQPKKRRHKLEAILQNTADEGRDDVDGDDEHLRKHGNILKKYQTSMTAEADTAVEERIGERPQPVILDLAPLPQPEPAPTPEYVPDAAAIPSWIANPTVVSAEDNAQFSELNLEAKQVEHLQKLGFKDALPVQVALIPMLLPPGSPGALHRPGTESVLPDIAVSAPTGSGKTIAYLLPIMESLKKIAGHGKLTTLIVVPTRELVMQVAAVADSLARGTHIKVGMATGTGAFKDEQAKIVRKGRRYDPAGYRALIDRAHRRNYPPGDEDEDDMSNAVLEEETTKDTQHLEDAIAGLVDHVPTYASTYDILVATPGRLLEHLNNTLGFTLAHLQWLVLDEADKLLDLQYNGFLETINDELARPHNDTEKDARERYLRHVGAWNERQERRVRKVVLSATMTRDISKLVSLRLSRPQMLVVRVAGQADDLTTHQDGMKEVDGSFELPSTLTEYCMPVGDGSERPLFLVELLRTRILSDAHVDDRHRDESGDANAEAEADADSSEDDSSSDSSSSSSADSDSSSSDDDSGDDEQHGVDHKHAQTANDDAEVDEGLMHPSRASVISHLSNHRTTVPTILIFTSSNESTTRLTHLLQQIMPHWAPWIASMTRSEPKRKALPHNDPDIPLITIATDRAARGLDALRDRSITHVVQYDVPRSNTSYVHRVGRTARAGRYGEAWTLYSHSEARWFMKEVARTKKIKRVGEVERVKFVLRDDESRERLVDAVARMKDEVLGGKKR